MAPEHFLSDLDLYGFSLTASLAVETDGAFMRVDHHRRSVEPFEDTVCAGLDTHLAARATVAVDLDPDSHPTQPTCLSIAGDHTSSRKAFIPMTL